MGTLSKVLGSEGGFVAGKRILTTYEITECNKLEYEYFSSVKDFLESVKKIGANNSNKSQKANIALTREMIKTYEELYKIDGFVRATYHCVFACIRKSPLISSKVLSNN